MAGRKNFISGSILTAADVNGFLMDQSVMVFDDGTARTAAIPTASEGMVTYLKDTNQVTVFDGSAFTPVGTILQVVQTVKTDAFTTASGSLVDITGFSVSITPSSATSKVLVTFHANIGNTANQTTQITLLRDSTEIYIGTSGSTINHSGYYFVPQALAAVTSSGTFLDSPATTSALTYKMQMAVSGATGVFNRRGFDTNLGLPSSITVMEVAG